jgi:hypothetical protein
VDVALPQIGQVLCGDYEGGVSVEDDEAVVRCGSADQQLHG